MKSFVLFTIFIATAFTANASFSDRLKDIQDRLSLRFCPNLSDVQKIQVVNNLHNYLQNTNQQDAYGPGKLVQSIYIECPNTYTTPKRIESYSRLRGHALVANYELTSLNYFEQRIEQEKTILAKLGDINSNPFVEVRRDLDILTQTSGSNEHLLELLNYVHENILKFHLPITPELDKIVIVDSNNTYNKASIALVSSWYKANNKALYISVGHFDASAGDGLVVGARGVQSLFEAVFTKNLVQIDTLHVPNEQVESTLVNFSNFATEEILSLFNQNKVTQIVFKEEPRKAQNLFTNGVLTLGLNQTDMQFVVDLLFR